MFDGKCKNCEKQMEEVHEECPRNERGIYITYHCPHCGTYAYYYDCDKEPSQWIIPNNGAKITKELRKILEWCEKGKEYHQAIIELKIKIENGSL